MIKILIADDHPVVRQGFKTVLNRERGFSVTGEAATGPEVIEQCRNGSFDLLILDLSLPQLSGLDVLKQLHSEELRIPTLIVSVHAEERYALRALRAGAFGYLTKHAAWEQLVEAARTIAAGRKFITPTLAESLAEFLHEDFDRPLHERLSDREFEILRLIASGMGTTAIAEKLHLGVSTVSTYRSRILAKLKVRTTSELTHYAMQHGLIDSHL